MSVLGIVSRKGEHCHLCERELPIGEKVSVSFGSTFCLDREACHERWKSLNHVPLMTCITERFYIGPSNSMTIRSLDKIKYTINISGVPTDPKANEVIPIADDGYGRNKGKAQDFVQIIKSIDRERKLHKRVLVFCHAGSSRSPAIAALYMLYIGAFQSYDAALEYVLAQSGAFKVNPDLADFIKKEVLPLMVL